MLDLAEISKMQDSKTKLPTDLAARQSTCFLRFVGPIGIIKTCIDQIVGSAHQFFKKSTGEPPDPAQIPK